MKQQENACDTSVNFKKIAREGYTNNVGGYVNTGGYVKFAEA